MTKQISQREARALRKRVARLEEYFGQQRRAYASEWPGGVHLGGMTWQQDNDLASAVYVARRLGHAVVVVANGNHRIELYAIALGKLP